MATTLSPFSENIIESVHVSRRAFEQEFLRQFTEVINAQPAAVGFMEITRQNGRMDHGGSLSRGFPSGAWLDEVEKTPASAAEIHAALDGHANEVLRDAERVMEYRQMYPSNVFLTKGQVKALCLKYGLVLAPDFMFGKEIPAKNRAEIEAFRLAEKHDQVMSDFCNDGYDGLRMAANSMNSYGVLDFQVAMRGPEKLDTPCLLVANRFFALFCPAGIISLMRWVKERFNYPFRYEYEMPATPVINTKRGFVRLDKQSLEISSLELRLVTNVRMRHIVSINFELQTPRMGGTISYSQDVCQMVVCPPDLLLADLPIRSNEGYEIMFDERSGGVQGRGADPIILQPVEGGYLVVTKWDAEAKLEEVQSPQEN